MGAGSTLAKVAIDSREALRHWLIEHHERSGSVWLMIWKKGDDRHVEYDAVVEELLAFGWIDSLPRKLDETRSMLLVSPRKPGSAWSARNKARIEHLTSQGLMTARGNAVVEQAKADGSWSKLDGVEALSLPEDLASALDRLHGARRTWDDFPRSVKRGLLEWVEQAKRPETRARRVAEIAADTGAGRRPHQFRQPKTSVEQRSKSA